MYQYRSVKRYDATYKRYVSNLSHTFFMLNKQLYEQMISNLRVLSEE